MELTYTNDVYFALSLDPPDYEWPELNDINGDCITEWDISERHKTVSLFIDEKHALDFAEKVREEAVKYIDDIKSQCKCPADVSNYIWKLEKQISNLHMFYIWHHFQNVNPKITTEVNIYIVPMTIMFDDMGDKFAVGRGYTFAIN